MRLFLIRHGQSLENLNGPLPPDADPPLTELGRRQAQRVADRFAGMKLDVLYCGPLRRNLQTAIPLARATGLDPCLLPSLHEVGSTVDATNFAYAVEQFPRIRILSEAAYDRLAPNETRVEAFERAGALVAWLCGAHVAAEQAVAVVTHGMFSDLLLSRFLGMAFADYTRFSTGNCAVHIVDVTPDRLKVLKLNDESHLPEPDRT